MKDASALLRYDFSRTLLSTKITVFFILILFYPTNCDATCWFCATAWQLFAEGETITWRFVLQIQALFALHQLFKSCNCKPHISSATKWFSYFSPEKVSWSSGQMLLKIFGTFQPLKGPPIKCVQGARNLATVFEVEDGATFQIHTAGDGVILRWKAASFQLGQLLIFSCSICVTSKSVPKKQVKLLEAKKNKKKSWFWWPVWSPKTSNTNPNVSVIFFFRCRLPEGLAELFEVPCVAFGGRAAEAPREAILEVAFWPWASTAGVKIHGFWIDVVWISLLFVENYRISCNFGIVIISVKNLWILVLVFVDPLLRNWKRFMNLRLEHMKQAENDKSWGLALFQLQPLTMLEQLGFWFVQSAVPKANLEFSMDQPMRRLPPVSFHTQKAHNPSAATPQSALTPAHWVPRSAGFCWFFWLFLDQNWPKSTKKKLICNISSASTICLSLGSFSCTTASSTH